ncbi:DUF4873 domain-containing protein [Segniliparus rugosus]|uniref:DUF4873 domain-containing protein n=1 Tax=Segniliparus rugosus (strain ATCC BAA-974 / DSM 45345 / CCUG 50838 / CIP 108380 / JCM 13579 / CDC 945) TaxID=679197 RepID=E5XQT6_SEGRC|nr:DUF4873 domain-containing protein [Segniliparus rugosus]EFV13271.1 hypothetical protein HMPREF9336_01858 [Segniliparus rugosus ATCC BAA-974]
MADQHAEHDYEGPAEVEIEGTTLTADVILRGHAQPIDGRYRWYGRVKANDELKALIGERAQGTLATKDGKGKAVFDDLDFWDRYRVVGRSRPPFHLPATIEEADAEAAAHEAELLAAQQAEG